MAVRTGRALTPLVLLALLLAPLAVARAQDATPGAPPAPQVRGLLAPRDEAVLASQVPGRIAAMPVRNGQEFRKDDLLFAIDCRLYQAQLDKARSELATAERTAEVQRKLNDLGSGNRLDRNQAEGAVARARGDVAQLTLTIDLCTVRAPFDGKVVERKAQPFQTVGASQPVLEIHDTSNYDIQMLVPSAWLAWVRPGVPFRLHLDETGQDHAALVETIAAKIDPASQSIKIIGRFETRPEGLISGMSGTAFFQEGGQTPAPAPAPAAAARPAPAAEPRPAPRAEVPASAVARPRWDVEAGVARPVWQIEAPGGASRP